MTIKKQNQAYDILSKYEGSNPYILSLWKSAYTDKNTSVIGDFQVEYIINNYKKEPKPINKIVNVVDWYAEKKKKEWNLEFLPKKIRIVSYLGEVNGFYHCYIQYRQSVEPSMLFLPKKAVLDNFFVDDYNKLEVDFERYDNLCTIQGRKIKESQKIGIKFLLSRKKCILADEMGYGKTTEMVIAAMEGNFDSVLVICPASIKNKWKDEICYYVPEKDVTVIDSFDDKTKPELEKFLGYKEGKSGLKRDELLEEAKKEGRWQENHYVIVNYDILEKFYQIPKGWSDKKIKEAFDNSPLLQYITNRKSLIIIDEAHKLSNKDSNRYKIIKNLINRGNPDSVYLATGTPVTNNPQNLFCVLQLINDPVTEDWEYFVNRYCGAMKIPAKGEKEKWTNFFLKSKRKANWFQLTSAEKEELKKYISEHARKITILKDATNLDELKQRISHIYLRRVKEDLEGIVTKHVHEMFYDLSPAQQIEYDNLWAEYEELKKQENPDKDINKELLEGAVYRKYISNATVPHTENIVDKLLKRGEKVVIACCYDEELYTLKEYYGDRCVIYNGKMSLKQKDNAIKEFYENDNVRVFIGNITAAGVGIDLVNARYMVFNNMSYVPGDDRQMEDRIFRLSQKRDCHIVYQIFRNTQYEKMWNTVMKKELVIDQIIKKENDK